VDSLGHLLPAVNLARGHGLVNEVTPLRFLDPAGHNRFVMYPPLFPMTIAAMILMHPTAPAALFAVSILNCLTLLLFVLLIRKLKPFGSEGRSPTIVVLGIFAEGAILAPYFQGRAEVLGTLLSVIIASVLLGSSGRRQIAMVGVLLGLLAAAHPAGALLCIPLVSAFYAARCSMKRMLIILIALGTLLAVTAFTVCLASPISIADLIKGILAHAAHIAAPQWIEQPHEFFRHYLFDPLSPGFGFLLLFSLVLSYRWLWRHKKELVQPQMTIGCVTVFWLLLYVLAVRTAGHWYYSLFFAPLFICLIISETTGPLVTRFPRVLSMFCLSLVAVGFWRYAALFPSYCRSGLTLRQARREFSALTRDDHDRPIAVTYSLWVLTDEYHNLQACDYSKPETVRPGSLIFIQQNYLPFRDPQLAPPGYVLAKNEFVEGIPRLGPLPLARKIPGYNFVFYRPKNDPSIQSKN
jgi:hypothetical protein